MIDDTISLDGLTADNFAAEAAEVVAATVRGDAQALSSLSEKHREALANVREKTPLSINPWNNPLVAYGAMMGLAESTEIASRTVVPPDVLKAVLNSAEIRRILTVLSEQPGGMVKRSQIPELTGMDRSNVHHKLKKLGSLGLITFHSADPGNSAHTIELESKGHVAAQLTQSWGLDEHTRGRPSS